VFSPMPFLVAGGCVKKGPDRKPEGSPNASPGLWYWSAVAVFDANSSTGDPGPHVSGRRGMLHGMRMLIYPCCRQSLRNAGLFLPLGMSAGIHPFFVFL